MQVKSLQYFVIFSVSPCQSKFKTCDFFLVYWDFEQFKLFKLNVIWRRWTTLLWVDACSTKIPSHYDMAVQNHQATNCGTAKGHIHKLCRFFWTHFCFLKLFVVLNSLKGLTKMFKSSVLLEDWTKWMRLPCSHNTKLVHTWKDKTYFIRILNVCILRKN